jgi:hypothetical protein
MKVLRIKRTRVFCRRCGLLVTDKPVDVVMDDHGRVVCKDSAICKWRLRRKMAARQLDFGFYEP